MTTLTKPLHDEHKELMPQVERIRQVAESIGELPDAETCRGIEAVYDFLAGQLIPHASAEDQALYPVVQKVLGSPDATKTMSRDHIEVGRYIDELAIFRNGTCSQTLTAAQIKSLRRILYGVYALLKVHFAKEEEVYLPILDQRLSPEAARDMFGKMEAAAHKAKHALHVN